jgi:ATP-dependent DNA ligase
LNRREAGDTAILYAFDLIERDGKDMRNRPFLDRKAALARLLRDTEAGILFNEHIVDDGPIVFAHACRLGAEGIVSKKVDGTYRSGRCRVWIKVGTDGLWTGSVCHKPNISLRVVLPTDSLPKARA